MAQLFVLNSGYGLMTSVAAVDAGIIAAGGTRVLVSANAAAVPETSRAPAELPQLSRLRERFDRVESLNELLAPVLPTSWTPDPEEAPLLERLLRRRWGIDDEPVELFLQSPQVPPSRTIAALFPSARITIVGDGLMTYSPIRDRLPRLVVERVARVVYADVVPGVRPLVFAETGAPRIPVPPERLRAVLDEVALDRTDEALERLARDRTPTAIVLGQYLAALGLVTAAEESRMQADMVERALAWGPGRIVFKPHPSAPPALSDALAARAAAHGLDWRVYEGDAPAEVLALRLQTVGVVAGFSSALPTVGTALGLPIAAVGNRMLLRRLSPYENGNRVPVTIVDALTRHDPVEGERLQELVDAVGYCMQPAIMSAWRPIALAVLGALDARDRDRYFDAGRLGELDLPGGATPGLLGRVLASDGGAGRVEQVRLTLRGTQRRVARAWKALQGR